MSEYNDKEVYFHEYCKKCKHETKSESEDPCWECLTEPKNINSHKPLYFEPKEEANEH